MKSQIYLLLFSFLLTAVSGCVDDKGNYDYDTLDDIFSGNITGMKKNYYVGLGESIQISPVLESFENEDELEYSWYVIYTPPSSSSAQKVELANTKDFDYTVALRSGSYTLYYQIRHPEKDIYKETSVNLIVQSEINYGYYVLKDDEGFTDFDYIRRGDETFLQNVLATISSENRIPGKAIKMDFIPSRYAYQTEDEEGNAILVDKVSVYHVLTDEDYRVLDYDDLSTIKTFDNLFYTQPLERKPENFVLDGATYSFMGMINNGRVHHMYLMGAHIGKYGFEKAGDYYLHPDMVYDGYAAVVFDTISRSLLRMTTGSPTLTSFNQAISSYQTDNMNYRMLRMLPRLPSNLNSTAYALMQHMGSNQRVILPLNFYSTSSPVVSNEVRTIPNGCRLPDATVMAAHQNASAIYFGEGNKLYIHRVTSANSVSERESVIKQFSDRETVAFIRHLKVDYVTVPAENRFNYLAVLTNTVRSWNLYLFELKGATYEINPDPVNVYQGKGSARYLMYRAEDYVF